MRLQLFECAVERALQDQSNGNHRRQNCNRDPRQRARNHEQYGDEKQCEQKIRGSNDGARGKKLPRRIEIPHLVGQDTDRYRPLGHLDREDVLENIGSENHIEFLAGHVDDPRADGPQQEVENNGKGKPDRERSQRRNCTVRHDAVIDVHREERCGEPEHVDNECGNGDVAVIRSEAANDTPEPVRFREVSRCGRSFACRRGRPDEEDVTEIIVFEGGGPHFDLFARGRVDEGQLLCDCIDFGEDAGRLISGDQ